MGPEMGVDQLAVDEQGFGGAANASAAHLGIEHDVHRQIAVGGFVDIDMHDAFEMGEDGHARFVLHPLDQAAAAARHDDVDIAVQAP